MFGTEAKAGGRRTDTILVVRVDPRAQRTTVLSIHRDLFAPIAGTNRLDRVNAAFAGGPQRLIANVREALDIPGHHYVELDFTSFRKVVAPCPGSTPSSRPGARLLHAARRRAGRVRPLPGSSAFGDKEG